jgi:hypothetical protein
VGAKGFIKPVNYYGNFQEAVEELRESVPPSYPVSVRRTKMNFPGDCELKIVKIKGKAQQRFVIRISRFMDEQSAIMTLLHEWAHALVWEVPGAKDHGAEWGVAYARVYRAYLKVT